MVKSVWSSGGGVQSNAIAALIIRGEIKKPDIGVISDTGRELSTTWNYFEKYTRPALEEFGLEFHRIKKEEFATVDLYSKKGDRLLLPAFTDESGEIGKLPTNCSNEWKERVVQRFLRQRFPEERKFEIWLGMTMDELKRVKQTTGKWVKKYPLIEQRLWRMDCIRICHEMGWPTPPKSTCWMCPNQSHAQWVETKNNNPEDFAKAIELEKQIRQEDDSIFLHRSGVVLDEISDEQNQPDLFTGRCDSGYCFT